MGFNAWNKPYRRTALAVNKHVYTKHLFQAHHEESIIYTYGYLSDRRTTKD